MTTVEIYKKLLELVTQNNPQQLRAVIDSVTHPWEEFRVQSPQYTGQNKVLFPLLLAAEQGYLECVKAFEGVACQQDWREVFTTAVSEQKKQVVRWVLPKLDSTFVEDWSCAAASHGDLSALNTTKKYLTDHGKQMVLYYAASARHDNVVDAWAPHTNADEVLSWMLSEENLLRAEDEVWIENKRNQLQRARLMGNVESDPAPTRARKI